MIRGQVLPLMGSERLMRMLYLGGRAGIDVLDSFVRKDGAPMKCPDIYYLLKEHNGGKDPTAPDPADRWIKPGGTHVNRTSDCIGGMAWCGGFDRYQPVRFNHIYGGWINTDSMRQDAKGPARCFKFVDPEPGCFVVYGSDPKKKTHGVRVGHIAGVTRLPDFRFDPANRDWWAALEVVDVANRTPNKANKFTTGLGWYKKDAYFVVPIMQP